MKDAHFRIIFPQEQRGKIHVANRAKVLMEYGEGNILDLTEELPVVGFKANWNVNEPTGLTLYLRGTVEVAYERGVTP